MDIQDFDLSKYIKFEKSDINRPVFKAEPNELRSKVNSLSNEELEYVVNNYDKHIPAFSEKTGKLPSLNSEVEEMIVDSRYFAGNVEWRQFPEVYHKVDHVSLVKRAIESRYRVMFFCMSEEIYNLFNGLNCSVLIEAITYPKIRDLFAIKECFIPTAYYINYFDVVDFSQSNNQLFVDGHEIKIRSHYVSDGNQRIENLNLSNVKVHERTVFDWEFKKYSERPGVIIVNN